MNFTLYRNMLSLLLVLVSVAPAMAGDLFRRNRPPKASVVTSINVTWFEKGNAIVHNSVCLDYINDDGRYPVCRQRARELFRNKCSEAARANSKTEMPDPTLRAEVKKFCTAAKTFTP